MVIFLIKFFLKQMTKQHCYTVPLIMYYTMTLNFNCYSQIIITI